MKNNISDPYQCTGCWYLSIFYFNPEDPRIIVLRKSRLGWTLNLARPMAIPLLLIIIALVLAPFKALDHFGIESGGAHILAFVAVLVGLVTFCSWMSNPYRFEKKLKKTEPPLSPSE
jgi:hypothetical protein